jgi:hypothetical protein
MAAVRRVSVSEDVPYFRPSRQGRRSPIAASLVGLTPVQPASVTRTSAKAYPFG